jgi:isocitrate dehydrogenase
MKTLIPIVVAFGDGIGPEIMAATLAILKASGAPIDPQVIEVGEKVYAQGFSCGIPDDAWGIMKRIKVLLKAPITTPQGSGYKSLNVTMRKTLGLYANVRPSVALSPFVKTHFPKTDLVIIRENEEDLYAGIEYRQTNDVYQCLKLISRSGSERIIRYAFEYAKNNGRKKVTCFVKDNIMKMTDGIFHRVFDEIAQEYPSIEHDNKIVDIGTALIADSPEVFDVIVTENLYGDIISDVAAQVVGSVGMAGSANVGDDFAMFEAIHGSAPDIAGKNIANPSGLLNAAVLMLVHIGCTQEAAAIKNAWLLALEEGQHTGDIFNAAHSRKKCTTAEFAEAVIARLGKLPTLFPVVKFGDDKPHRIVCVDRKDARVIDKQLVGIDVYLDDRRHTPAQIGEVLATVDSPFALEVITSRGLKVWPGECSANLSDHWRCRFLAKDPERCVDHAAILALLAAVSAQEFDIIKTENLYRFDGEPGYTVAQGQ